MRKMYLGIVLLLVASVAGAQQNFDAVQIKAEKVGGTVYMLVGAGGNIGASVGEDGIVIVDDQYAPLAPKILDALKAISDKPIKFILNTHFHGDHTGGNEILGRTAPIVAHTNVRNRLKSGMTMPGREVPPAPKSALPIVTFDAGLTLHVNGEDIRAIHYPSGHTDGDAVIWFTQSNVVHMGDDFFNGMFPFVDIDSGGSVRGMMRAVDKVLATVPDDAKIIPGHGPLADKAALRAYAEMLRGTSAAVQAAIKAGKTVDQAKAQKVLAKWEKMSWRIISTDAFTEVLYREYAPKKK